MNKVKASKMMLTASADQSLDAAIIKVNENFEGGRISKSDLASWAIDRLWKDIDEDLILEIQTAYFNQAAYLENLLRKMKQDRRNSLSKDEVTFFSHALQTSQAIRLTEKKSKRKVDSLSVPTTLLCKV